VHVELAGSGGASSGRRALLAAGDAAAFSRGKVDAFQIRCQALGELSTLRIGHDGRGTHPAWHLTKVRVCVCV
jgi:hypothetical protein